jgi:hypothetical protein
MPEQKPKYTNQLVHQSSPYLLQHAHNPVNWFPWSKEILERAKAENKPLIVSIGYSACHWCHVMEHESFEDEEVAKVMNEHFICIKVDREERPDVDHIYMSAIQIISGRGGWPLNCFALPDGRPFWGGTYFQKSQWLGIMNNVQQIYQKQEKKLIKQAEDIAEGIVQTDFALLDHEATEFISSDLDQMILGFNKNFDITNGGAKGAPKFPMPNNYLFLLRLAALTGNVELQDQVMLTLDKMAAGGIYDQLGGGFSRYSVDDHWHIPHFEKMLYDNAQLVTLYAEAFQQTKSEDYKKVVFETLNFIQNEMTSPEGAFYSAYDADSEGEEGTYYVWTKQQIEKISGENTAIIYAYFGINEDAYWENGKNVLIKAKSIKALSELFDKNEGELESIVSSVKAQLFELREQREKPGLDDKILCSWNALMLHGFVSAYFAFGEKKYLRIAERNADFLLEKFRKPDGGLFRSGKKEKAGIDGFLEDYSYLIHALIQLYQASFNDHYLYEAKRLSDYVIEHFYDEKIGMFYFAPKENTELISRKIEVTDQVTPSSNSMMADSLLVLGKIFEQEKYISIANRMLQNVKQKMIKFPGGFSNWGIALMKKVLPFYQIVITGRDFSKKFSEWNENYLPNIIRMGEDKSSKLPPFKHRFIENKTMIFVCNERGCQLPVEEVEDALKQVKSNS